MEIKICIAFLMKSPRILIVLYTVCPVYCLSSLLFVPIYLLPCIPCVPLAFVRILFVVILFVSYIVCPGTLKGCFRNIGPSEYRNFGVWGRTHIDCMNYSYFFYF